VELMSTKMIMAYKKPGYSAPACTRVIRDKDRGVPKFAGLFAEVDNEIMATRGYSHRK